MLHNILLRDNACLSVDLDDVKIIDPDGRPIPLDDGSTYTCVDYTVARYIMPVKAPVKENVIMLSCETDFDRLTRRARSIAESKPDWFVSRDVVPIHIMDACNPVCQSARWIRV